MTMRLDFLVGFHAAQQSRYAESQDFDTANVYGETMAALLELQKRVEFQPDPYCNCNPMEECPIHSAPKAEPRQG